ncbi:MAG: molecular chaperone HtpG [Oscillospiraceae bacterium]|jgi:molecular chaperone HtpG|nr:molecular chaperone HtpG [Oscillospiraceae bacterium]
MAKKAFKAESQRLLDLMINSIYIHKEIFLRELISNASDALDKQYFTDFNREGLAITVKADKDSRALSVTDTGIGMTKGELESNLGTIARSGSLDFKNTAEEGGVSELIGRFGVGFYSAFMVASSVSVVSRSSSSDESWEWFSEGTDGFTVRETAEAPKGTTVTVTLKENSPEENYDEFLEPDKLKDLVRKYSDFIRYPIIIGGETVNSMVPIWRKNKNELTDEDYNSFYKDGHFGYDTPLRHIHVNVDGAVSYTAILYIPAKVPFDYYSREYEKGLRLYSGGVMIMQRCPDLLPDYFSFVQGLVDSADLSLNISRELLQHDRQLRLMAKRILDKIKTELLDMLEHSRETYEAFWANFGKQIKYGIYADFGLHKDILKDLLLFHSSALQKRVTLREYVADMKDDQKFIYYAAGENINLLTRTPQAELLREQGTDILCLTDEIDEFAVRVMGEYNGKPFQNISEASVEPASAPETTAEQKAVLAAMLEVLKGKVADVKASARLKSHPVCLTSGEGFSFEMEKVLTQLSNDPDVKAKRILELNVAHPVFAALSAALGADKERFNVMSRVLHCQALLVEGLPLEDPISFADDIWRLI